MVEDCQAYVSVADVEAAILAAPSLDENGYIVTKANVLAAIRGLAHTPAPPPVPVLKMAWDLMTAADHEECGCWACREFLTRSRTTPNGQTDGKQGGADV